MPPRAFDVNQFGSVKKEKNSRKSNIFSRKKDRNFPGVRKETGTIPEGQPEGRRSILVLGRFFGVPRKGRKDC